MDLLDLFVRIGAKDEATPVVEGMSSGITGKVGGMARKAAGLMAGLFAVDKVAEFGSAALEAFGQYEQLVGGVQKLYGNSGKSIEEYAAAAGKSIKEVTAEYEAQKAAEKAVMDNAANAYETVGMSANKYMETATQFSAAMTASLGGDVVKSAEKTQLAMQAISDNVNVFGSDMEDVTNAFKGFSKQNYTMLDNLKLGYGGTKEEMQRLIADAASMTDQQKELGVTVDANSMSFANITNAIAVVQQGMGIMGTTANEAAGTVEGSVNMMKAAWENFVTGLGTGGDMSKLTSNLVSSLATVAKNVVPVIGNIANGLFTSIGPMAKQAIGYLTDAVSNFDFGEALSSLVDNLSGAVAGVIDALAGFVDEGMPRLIEKVPGILASVASAIVRNAPKLLAAVGTLIGSLLKYIVGFGARIGAAFGGLITKGVKAVLGFVGDFKAAAGNLIDGLVSGLANAKDAVVNKIKEIAKGAVDTFKSWLGIKSPSKVMAQMGGYMMQGLANGIEASGSKALSAMRDVASGLVAAGSVDVGARVRGGMATGSAGAPAGIGGVVINLNYSAGADANQMALDIADALRRLTLTEGAA